MFIYITNMQLNILLYVSYKLHIYINKHTFVCLFSITRIQISIQFVYLLQITITQKVHLYFAR
jgi:hypothetical protein